MTVIVHPPGGESQEPGSCCSLLRVPRHPQQGQQPMNFLFFFFLFPFLQESNPVPPPHPTAPVGHNLFHLLPQGSAVVSKLVSLLVTSGFLDVDSCKILSKPSNFTNSHSLIGQMGITGAYTCLQGLLWGREILSVKHSLHCMTHRSSIRIWWCYYSTPPFCNL